MLSKEELKRYNRQINLSEIGISGQEKLKAARVLVVGAGGLGCPVLQYLVAAGVGTVGIVDDDVVDESNLQRQILYSFADTGKSKAEVAAEKLRQLNPNTTIIAFNARLTEFNATELISNFDLVVDGSDNFETRYLVNDTCVELGKALVFGSIFGFEGQISVFNYQGGPTYRCVFPEPGEAPNCAVNGVLGVLPGIIGSYMANEALKIILETGETLSGKLMVIDVLNNRTNVFKVNRLAPERGQVSSLAPGKVETKGTSSREISIDEMDLLLKGNEYLLIDVREPNEFEADDFGGINIPISEVADYIQELPNNKKIIFLCNTGTRSKLAVDLLRQINNSVEAFWTRVL